MNLNDLINTIEKMQADLSALKLKARAIQPAIEALASLSGAQYTSTDLGVSFATLRVGDVLVCSEKIVTHNSMNIPANTEITVSALDSSGVPLYVRWALEEGGAESDWVVIAQPGDRKGILLSKTRKIN